MRRLRTILVTTPSLSAELARSVLAGRAGVEVIVECDEFEIATRDFRGFTPDAVVIVARGSPEDARRLAAVTRARFPLARVVTLSADFTWMLAHDGELGELSIDRLVDAIRR